MNKILLLSSALILSARSHGQNSVYDHIELGKYHVGFTDTVVLDGTLNYKAYGYDGDKPYFIQIWHPLKRVSKGNSYLPVSHFFQSRSKPGYEKIQTELKKNYRDILIQDYLSENLATGDSAMYGTYTYEHILDQIGLIETRSTTAPLNQKANFPVIVYHHGSQSNSFENFVMAEYFASRGFIFVSANFHLPYEDKPFGLKPFDQLVQGEEETSAKTVIQFAKSLTNDPSVFFIGHSWGAQMGFRALDADSTIQGFVSLETTLEFKKDSSLINEYWPELYQKLFVDSTRYPFPILMCAAMGHEKPSMLTRHIYSPELTFASTPEEFEHNAYTSLFYLRYFIDSKIEQSDKSILLNRLALYAKHLEVIYDFIRLSMQYYPMPQKITKYVLIE